MFDWRVIQDNDYKTLVINALKSYGILCLGLYRRMYPDTHSNPNRYVITNPSASLTLSSSDQVRPYNVHYSFVRLYLCL